MRPSYWFHAAPCAELAAPAWASMQVCVVTSACTPCGRQDTAVASLGSRPGSGVGGKHLMIAMLQY